MSVDVVAGVAVRVIPVSEVVFREDLYPRLKHDPVTVQRYAEDLGVLPPIELNHRLELIDGWHRLTAHKKAGATTIRATLTRTKSDAHLLELAITRNATHGLQLSRDDKEALARRLYRATPVRDREALKPRLEKILSVDVRSVQRWTADIDKDERAARNKKIRELRMAGWTQQEIADEVGLSRRAVSDVLAENDNCRLAPADEAAATHATDFQVPLYSLWSWRTKSEGVEHFGNSEPRILDNLLYLYTAPFDLVVDPFAGGGSTVEVCKKRFRRYYVSDRAPIPERADEIRRHDLVVDGLPKVPEWDAVRLVYLDPPYWKQAHGEYSKDATDLANMPLEEFFAALAGIVNAFAAKLSNAKIALLMQATQWEAPGHAYTDHLHELTRRITLPIEMEVQCPYQTEQCLPQMVEWAKANHRCLVITRQLLIWRVE